jgi:2-isopropylmalate synthase
LTLWSGYHRGGFPIASEDDYAAVREVARVCRRPIIAALCRTTDEDIERAWSALSDAAHPRIHTFVATSDIHLQYKLQKSREEVLDMACRAVRLAKGSRMTSSFPRKTPPELTSITCVRS